MMFTELLRDGDPAHVSAIGERAAARVEQRQRAVHARAAVGTPSGLEMACLLHEAIVEVHVRDAWVGWIERGV